MRNFPLAPAFAALDAANVLLAAVAPSGYSDRSDPRVHEAADLIVAAIALARKIGISEPTLYRLHREHQLVLDEQRAEQSTPGIRW